MRRAIIGLGLAGLWATTVFALAAENYGPYRFKSPSGQFDIVLRPVSDDAAATKKPEPGAPKEATKQYVIDFFSRESNQAVNSLAYSDLNPPASPETIVGSMVWSPKEAYVLLPDRPKMREKNHVVHLVASLSARKVWGLESDHAQWVDDHRLIGDVNTDEIPGALVLFDGTSGEANIVLQPDTMRGYQIAAVRGPRVTVKEQLNERTQGKTTWEYFDPACFTLDLDTLKKRSCPCPATRDKGITKP